MPDYIARRFADGVTPDALRAALALSFNVFDRLQARWAARYMTAVEPALGHRMPSAQAFQAATEAGTGWGLNP